MNVATAVAQIRANPNDFLSGTNGHALHGFFVGYKAADASARVLFDGLAAQFDGPSTFDGFTRAVLSSPDENTAYANILAALERIVKRNGAIDPVPGYGADAHFVEAIRDAVRQGRPAMVLGEPTVLRLHDHVTGFLVGLSAVRQEAAARQSRRLAEFEAWLRVSYSGPRGPTPSAKWSTLIRVFGGVCDRGLEEFVTLWEEFELERPERP